MRRGALAVLAAACLGLGAATTGAPAAIPNLDWTAVLPPVPAPESGPRPVAFCRKPSLRCVTVAAHRLRRLRDRLGCDHRAVFATTYFVLTRELRETVREDPDFFRYPSYFFREDALFANVYLRTVRAWSRGEEVAAAWRIAFEGARDKDLTGVQDQLLGINAHVQNDMPFVIASLGLRSRSGGSIKPDHDRANEVLNRAFEPVIRAVRRRYDPSFDLSNPTWSPHDDLTGLEMVRIWREGVWRNAERLVDANSPAERRQVARQIHENAATWARALAADETPGYRETRDAYCLDQFQ
jgi:Family of unknown function (DUF5995)